MIKTKAKDTIVNPFSLNLKGSSNLDSLADRLTLVDISTTKDGSSEVSIKDSTILLRESPLSGMSLTIIDRHQETKELVNNAKNQAMYFAKKAMADKKPDVVKNFVANIS